ncbi:glycosyl hydrolase 115 family protein [Opitutus sp. ER46]|uniref:glycosyl hydrolase 115 family protein n=1 Tax=Opitutus sp. ER46 TaxID=2161864 RepID=UPI000D316A50|nr:glycosyl hydrolase 115 family protein [Opitutus sp. ER46]PTX91416.1 hypothetical protein DB354_16105 [Opitutus sp. ER46]
MRFPASLIPLLAPRVHAATGGWRCRLPAVLALGVGILLAGATSARAEPWVRSETAGADFALVARDGATATLMVSPTDAKVVNLAAADLARDIERVTGRRPAIATTPFAGASGPLVLIGTLGANPLIDLLVADRKLEATYLSGAWESFLIATVTDPFPNVPRALVIVGSDRRGTAFGVYELAEAIGVSPWHWWADVAPAHQEALYVAAGARRFGPPSVKYRGVFLNDEDWGLQPWAARTLEPEHGGIGPRTYAKLFELMLRLKANTVWPAMHACTKAFNAFPEHRQLADDYAMVMGSSHAEPMLRNNVGEWTEPGERYDYVSNAAGVRAYWEQRVRENGAFENIYTLGMRGVHDSGIQGAKTDAERIAVLERVFADQRALLAQHARGGGRAPQMFCAYKEVLGLYRQGLKVPDDVTIVWPDDNFGYVRNYASTEEQKRAGGFGVYYHLSYLGAPMAYLWLYTTPPALVWEEMTKAYAHGARTLWIANVGDLKPAEIGTEFFLQLAWDVDRWTRETEPDFLRTWAAREFGEKAAPEIAAILAEYYALNFTRKPEHLQPWLPKQSPRLSGLSVADRQARLERFDALRRRTEAVGQTVRPELRDAFFELVAYPVHGSALANERFLRGELAAIAPTPAEQEANARHAMVADAALKELTRRFNEEIAGGKWRGFMHLEPADEQWKSFRLLPWTLPAAGLTAEKPTWRSLPAGTVVVQAEASTGSRPGAAGTWEMIRGLGHDGDAVTLFPTTAPSVALAEVATKAARLDYTLELGAGQTPVTFHLIPTQPLQAGRGLRFAVALDDAAPREVVLDVRDGSGEWALGVIANEVTVTVPLEVAKAGTHVLRLYAIDAGVVIDRLSFPRS